jgi:hypothetical protein
VSAATRARACLDGSTRDAMARIAFVVGPSRRDEAEATSRRPVSRRRSTARMHRSTRAERTGGRPAKRGGDEVRRAL